MTEPITRIRKSQRWSDFVMSPGVVGSVGDVVVTPFLKTSNPDLPRRVDKTFAGDRAVPLGSNVQDGGDPSYSTDGYCARTYDSSWGGNRSFKFQTGWLIQDVRTPDKMVEPFVSQLGDYSWRNKIAKVTDSFKTGSYFANLPGELSSRGIPRGGQMPRTTDFAADMNLYSDNSFLPKPTKKKEEKMTFWETAMENIGEATKKVYDPLTAEQVKEFEQNTPTNLYDLKGF